MVLFQTYLEQCKTKFNKKYKAMPAGKITTTVGLNSKFTTIFKTLFVSCLLVRAKLRVATAQGKQGIWMFIFPDRENTGNLPKSIKNMILHREFASNTGKILLKF